MMTPDSIINKHFDKAMGGYRQDEVDAFLRQVAEELRELQAENAALEQKVEVLANKIEEYRADEDSLRSALVGAQKLGSSVISESKAKAEAIILDAQAESAKILESAKRSVEIEQTALVQMKKEVTKFKNRMLTMYRQHLDIISSLPEYADELVANEMASLEEAMEPAQEEVPEIPVVEEIPVAPAEEEVVLDFSSMAETEPTQEQPAMGFAEISTPSSENNNSKFGQLKFGEGFDVERDGKKSSIFNRKKNR